MFVFEEAASDVVFLLFHLKYISFISLNLNYWPLVVVSIYSCSVAFLAGGAVAAAVVIVDSIFLNCLFALNFFFHLIFICLQKMGVFYWVAPLYLDLKRSIKVDSLKNSPACSFI